jgi:hypothetical protein
MTQIVDALHARAKEMYEKRKDERHLGGPWTTANAETECLSNPSHDVTGMRQERLHSLRMSGGRGIVNGGRPINEKIVSSAGVLLHQSGRMIREG